jgi:hypothetical protein
LINSHAHNFVLEYHTAFIMAPRRTSGGSSRYSTTSCPNAYITTDAQIAIAYYVLFLVLFMGVFILTFFIRKKPGAGKKLIGIPFVIALFLQVMYV